MLVLKRRPGEALRLENAATGEHLLDIIYSGYTDEAIIVETIKPDGERNALELKRGDNIDLGGSISRAYLSVQYSGDHNRKRQAVFCIFGAKNKISVVRRELIDRAKEAKKENDISKNQ